MVIARPRDHGARHFALRGRLRIEPPRLRASISMFFQRLTVPYRLLYVGGPLPRRPRCRARRRSFEPALPSSCRILQARIQTAVNLAKRIKGMEAIRQRFL